MDRAFLQTVEYLVRAVMPETLDRLEALMGSPDATPTSLRLWATELPQKTQREAVAKLAESWKASGHSIDCNAALAVLTTMRFAEEHRTKAEICWSGPTDSLHGLRATSIAYRELMTSAQRSVLILTYTVGEVESLRSSLEEVIRRGVAVKIIIEDFDVFSQKPCGDKVEHFGPAVAEQAEVFVWPVSNRRTHGGRVFGSMHVKCLIVDDEAMLLTSANWTGAAMQDNMELGAVIRNKASVQAASRHFDHLIGNQVLVPTHSA